MQLLVAVFPLWNMFTVLGWSTENLPQDFPGYFVNSAKLDHFSFTYRGCYKRNGQTDDGLPHQRTPLYTTDNTIEGCVQYCREKGYTYAGLQYGSGCRCGDEYYETYSTSCRNEKQVKCSGDHSAICGGADESVDVYKVCAVWTVWGNVYGASCQETCMDCDTAECYMDGTCIEKCSNGHQPQTDACSVVCDESDHYGVNCAYSNSNCVEDKVHPVNGYCILGCVSGFGPFCDQKPVSINRATGPCPVCSHCRDNKCVGDGGSSYFDCPMNWQGNTCADCPDGKWGDYCTKDCIEHCQTCTQDTGSCTGCQPGHYGAACDNLCSLKCDPKGCNRTGGECISCLIKGVYGKECQHECGFCVDHRCSGTGICSSCQSGYYGDTCTTACSSTCKGAKCDGTNGHCSTGCEIDFYNLPFCNASCPEHCNETRCDDATGECSGGCMNGHYGSGCHSLCSWGCINGCDKANGHCAHGCLDGFLTSTNCDECNDGFHGKMCNETCPQNCTRCDKDLGHCEPGAANDDKFQNAKVPPILNAPKRLTQSLTIIIILAFLGLLILIAGTLYAYSKAVAPKNKIQYLPEFPETEKRGKRDKIKPHLVGFGLDMDGIQEVYVDQ